MADAVKDMGLITKLGLIDGSVRVFETISGKKVFDVDAQLSALLFEWIVLAVALKELAANGGRAQVILDFFENLTALLLSFLELLNGVLLSAVYYIKGQAFLLKRHCELARFGLEVMIADHLAAFEELNKTRRK